MNEIRICQYMLCLFGVTVLLIGGGVVDRAIAGRGQHAIVTARSTDSLTSSYSWIQENKSGGSRLREINVIETASPIRSAAFGQYYYILEGGDVNRVTKYDVLSLDQPIYSYSVVSPGEAGAVTPWDMIFVDDTTAYLLRHDSGMLWVVNPSAATEDEFLLDTIDLSGFDESDHIPEMACGVYLDGKVYIGLQRLENGGAPGNACIAVIDTETHTLVSKEATGVSGIPLEVVNPFAMAVIEGSQTIYVAGCGNIDPVFDYTGGIETVDPVTWDTTLLLDDGDASDHPYGCVTGMAVITPETAFFTGAAAMDDQTLFTLDLSTGTVSEVPFNTTDTTYMTHKKLGGLDGGLGVDQLNRLWISNQTDNSVVIVNTTPNAEGKYRTDEEVSFTPDSAGNGMAPDQIVFCLEDPITKEETLEKPASGGESGNFCFIGTLSPCFGWGN